MSRLSLLAQLPSGLAREVWTADAAPTDAPSALELGWSELNEILPDGGLPHGGVTELAVAGGASLATSLALEACRAAQQRGYRQGVEVPWCAFVDPSATLYGPGVVQAGVVLERLVVVRPALAALGSVALRLVRSNVFATTVIDTVGIPGHRLKPIGLGRWARVVRQCSLALESSAGVVLLITDASTRRPLPLPVALRLELSRPRPHQWLVRVAKDKRGRCAGARSVHWPPTERLPSSLEITGSEPRRDAGRRTVEEKSTKRAIDSESPPRWLSQSGMS